MRLSARSILGKRGRNKMGAEHSAIEPPSSPPPPKRTTTRIAKKRVRVQTVASPRNGLLTPEPSVLAESHFPTEPLAPKDVFPFMDLPAELRLHVYHMALVRHEPITLHIDRAPEKTDEDSTWPKDSTTCTRSQAVGTSRPSNPSCPARTVAVEKPATPPSSDPVVPILLRLNKQIYKEARQLLYSENVFTLNLISGIHTLSTLHQRSRSLIKHVVLTIPSHHDILDGFADLVRLGLRYCWGLKSFKIILQASLPDDGRIGGATSVYANAFHILRWLPRGCSVVLEGCVSEMVRRVVVEEGRLMNVLDEVSSWVSVKH
jgi:epsin